MQDGGTVHTVEFFPCDFLCARFASFSDFAVAIFAPTRVASTSSSHVLISIELCKIFPIASGVCECQWGEFVENLWHLCDRLISSQAPAVL